MSRLKTFTALVPSVALILLGTIGLGFAQLAPRERPLAPLGILVLGQDAAGTLRVIAAADGRLVNYGGWLKTAVAVSDDPDFASKLYQAGATLVFRADGAVGCAGMTQALEGKS